MIKRFFISAVSLANEFDIKIINNINIDKQQHSVKKTTKQCLYQSVPNATDTLNRYEIIVKNIN